MFGLFMLYGLSGYRFDVPDGKYEVELLFSEIKFETAGKRVFSVKINGEIVIDHLDLVSNIGPKRAFIKTSTTTAANGINIEFTPLTGEPMLSGIRIKRIAGK